MPTNTLVKEFVHQELRTDYTGLAGYYCPFKEVKLDFEGRQILYVVGHAAIESSCCGISNWDYVLVPGYIIDWHKRTDDFGLPITVVEPVRDDGVRKELYNLISARENSDRISFD